MKKLFRITLSIFILITFIVTYSFPQPLPKVKEKELIHLRYAKVKTMAEMLKIMLPDMKIYPNEELGAIEIYDFPDRIKEAKELIEKADLPKRQVIIELKVLEISHKKSKEIGLELTNWSIALEAVLPPETVSSRHLGEYFPGLAKFKDEKADIKILATNNW
ncbi:MAG TPA: secretin N-terminal domain-containing protein [bacterium]|nr:secretin N-terminal domain-containing protein [bacterium]